LSEETITVTREHYERLKNERVVLFGANNGVWTDEELEGHAVDAAVEAAGNVIDDASMAGRPLAALTNNEFRRLIQRAAWAYMQVYVEYVPF